MSELSVTQPAIDAAAPARAVSYAPSWVNVVTRWFERLPGPTWLAYLIAMALGFPIVASQADIVTLTSSDAFAGAYYGALPFAVLGLIHSLDRTASLALRSLRPLLQLDDAEIAWMHHQLTVVPPRPAMVIALVAVVVTPVGYVADPVGTGVAGLAPAALILRYAWESLITAVFLVLIYHTVRQLRLIVRIHLGIGRLDVFDQGPLYAMSRLTSRTAVGLILLLAPSVFLIPADANLSYIVITAAWYGFAVVIAAAAFVLPLRGMHDRLAGEKRRLQGEVGRRITTTLEGLQVAVDAGDGPGVEARNRALSTLVAARDVVNRVPTWPWSGGALTGFASAIVLPIALFLVQRVLAQIV